MNPEECLNEFVRRCEVKAAHSYAVTFDILLTELKTEVRTRKYNSDRVLLMVSNVLSFNRRLLAINKLDVELEWLKTNWPLAVAVAQGGPSRSAAAPLVTYGSPSSAPAVRLATPESAAAAPSPSVSRSAPPSVAPPRASSTTLSSLKTDARIAEFAALASRWQVIKITDLPTSTPGVYEHSADDWVTNMQKGAAAGAVVKEGSCAKEEVLAAPEYWLRLGRMVLKSKKARCFSCAAVAAYLLTLEPSFDELEIAVWGAGEFDHHFASIGKSSEYADRWNGVVIIDIWDGNLNRTSGVCKYADFPYMLRRPGSYKRFCWFPVTDRAKHRAYAVKLDDESD